MNPTELRSSNAFLQQSQQADARVSSIVLPVDKTIQYHAAIYRTEERVVVLLGHKDKKWEIPLQRVPNSEVDVTFFYRHQKRTCSVIPHRIIQVGASSIRVLDKVMGNMFSQVLNAIMPGKEIVRVNGSMYFSQVHPRDTASCIGLQGNLAILDSTSIADLEKLARAFYDSDQFDEAETCLNKMLRLDPHSVFALSVLGEVLRIKNQFSKAKEYLLKAKDLDPPQSTYAKESLGAIARQEEDFVTAKKYLLEVLRLDPESVFALEHLGAVAFKEKEFDIAKGYLLNILKLKPHSGFALRNLGILLAELQQWDDAEIYLRRALELDPKSARAHEVLGEVLRQKRQLHEAKKHLLEALELTPTSAYAKESLGAIALEEKEFNVAKKYLLEALKYKSTSSFTLENLGAVALEEKEFDIAKKYLLEALKLDPTSTYALEHLGEIALEEKEWGIAKEYLQKALSLNPSITLYKVEFKTFDIVADRLRYKARAILSRKFNAPTK